jgi:hypothetical protein
MGSRRIGPRMRMKMHSGYITKHLRSATKGKLMDGIAGYNQGYDSDTPVEYRRIPADILAKIHGIEVELQRLHDQKQRLLKAGWETGQMPVELTNLMDRARHEANGAKLRARH